MTSVLTVKDKLPGRMNLARAMPAALLAFGLAFGTAGPGLVATAQAGVRVISISKDNPVSRIRVVAGTSETLRVSLPFSEIVVGDPETADVNPLTDKTLYVLGKKLGMTNVTLFDSSKKIVAVIDIEVTHNLDGMRQAINAALPGSHIKIKSVNGRLLLQGEVASAPAAEKAAAIAKDFAGDDVTNSIAISDAQQVNLEVRFVEVSRLAGKQFGINWNLGSGNNGINSGNMSPVQLGPLSGVIPFGTLLTNILGSGVSPDLLITALEQKNLARRLAEPNLTTLSGQTASFHAGGQVPVCTISSSTVVIGVTPGPSSTQCAVNYKDFGVQLEFTPTVLDDGLINLAVAPEVSDIDPSINVNGNIGFTTRRASTRVELRNGQSFAIAGLLQTVNAQTASQLPWLGDIPILGALFRSSEFQKKQTDLVIIVTPRLARPVGTEQVLQSPLDSAMPANEPEFFLLGKQEVSRKDLDKRYHGQYGFIVDLNQGANNGQ